MSVVYISEEVSEGGLVLIALDRLKSPKLSKRLNVPVPHLSRAQACKEILSGRFWAAQHGHMGHALST